MLAFLPSFALALRPTQLLGQRHLVVVSAKRAALAVGPAALTVVPLQAQASEADAAPVQLPQMLLADDGGIFGTLATVVVVGFLVIIGGFALDAAKEVASQTPERMDRVFGGGGGDAPQSKEKFVYDDRGTGANNKLPEPGLLKKSKQVKADGTRYAPWMIIDEDAVERTKKNRLQRKGKK